MRCAALALLGAALGLGAVSCTEDGNYLEGSISLQFDLDFDYVEVERRTDSIVIDYLDEVSYPQVSYRGVNSTVQLTIAMLPDSGDLKQEIDATDLIDLERYVIIYNNGAVEQDDRMFPVVSSAIVYFDKLSDEPLEAAEGWFSVVFAEGSGLRGGFAP